MFIVGHVVIYLQCLMYKISAKHKIFTSQIYNNNKVKIVNIIIIVNKKDVELRQQLGILQTDKDKRRHEVFTNVIIRYIVFLGSIHIYIFTYAFDVLSSPVTNKNWRLLSFSCSFRISMLNYSFMKLYIIIRFWVYLEHSNKKGVSFSTFPSSQLLQILSSLVILFHLPTSISNLWLLNRSLVIALR